MKPTNIVIIGAGNLAKHLANFIQNHIDLNLIQLVNHRISKDLILLAKQNSCNYTSKYNDVITTADIYIICVNDNAIKLVAEKLKPLQLKNLVLHTSGSIDISALNEVSNEIGVFYPLQTFSKTDLLDWNDTPILIEANSVRASNKLKLFSSIFSSTIRRINSKKRLSVHLAAVFGCNFTNALYAASFQIIQNTLSKNDTKLLGPIIKQSFNKLQTMGPLKSQTGPAKRNDTITMQNHLQLLKSNKNLSTIYKSLSQLILTQQNAKF